MSVKILCKDLGKVFCDATGKQVEALKEVSLQIEDKTFVSIVGPSGCGKSTLLNIIAGLTQPDSGKTFINNELLSAPGPDRGYVFQEFALFPWKTVLSNVEFGLKMQGIGKPERRQIAKRYIDLVGLRDFLSVYPDQLSGGMKQRVAIARAYAYNPEILLMDEPFGGLDALTRATMQKELINLWSIKQKTIVFVTHSVDESIYLSDKVVVFTTRPGTIKAVFNITKDNLLPGDRYAPEVKSSREFIDLSQEIWKLIAEEAINDL